MFYLFLETLFTDQDCRCFLFLFRPHATWSRGNLQTLKLCTKRFWPGRTRRSLALSTVSRANSWVTLKWLYQILLVTELLKVPGLGREEQAVSQAQFTSEVFLLALFFLDSGCGLVTPWRPHRSEFSASQRITLKLAKQLNADGFLPPIQLSLSNPYALTCSARERALAGFGEWQPRVYMKSNVFT